MLARIVGKSGTIYNEDTCDIQMISSTAAHEFLNKNDYRNP
jgi:hypothetical protein